MQVTRELGGTTIGFTGRDGGKLSDIVDICIRVASEKIVQQEDGLMILDHFMATTLRQLIEEEAGRERS